MAEFDGDIGRLEAEFSDLEGTLGGLGSVVGAFRRELDGVGGSMSEAGREASGMSRSVTSSIRSAFEGVIFDGDRLSDALANLGRSISGKVLSNALAPVQSAVGGGMQSILSGILPFARGAAFGAGRVAAFARGGVVDGPAHFPMRGGVEMFIVTWTARHPVRRRRGRRPRDDEHLDAGRRGLPALADAGGGRDEPGDLAWPPQPLR